MIETPHDTQTELALIGAVLRENNTLEVIGDVQADHFFAVSNQQMWQGVQSLYGQGLPIDEHTLLEEMRVLGFADIRPFHITEAINSIGTFKNVDVYADMVRRCYQRRRIADAAQQIFKLAMEGMNTVDEISAIAEDLLFQATSGIGSIHDNSLKHHAYQFFDDVERRQQTGALAGVPTGFAAYDEVTNGFHKGEVTLVGARPAMGKTSWMMNVLYNAAQCGAKVLFLSCEMSVDQGLMPRIMALDTGLDSRFILAGKFNDSHWEKFVLGTDSLANLSAELIYTPGLTVSQARKHAKRMQNRAGLDLVMIDYIGLMRAEGQFRNQNEAISSISMGIKTLAGELGVPIIAAAQLNRELKDTSDHRPQLWHLRDSGSLEQDADNVIFLHRPDYYNVTDRPGMTELIIAKQRNGQSNVTLTLRFLKQQTKFVDVR